MKNLKFVIGATLFCTILNAQKASNKEFINEVNVQKSSIPGIVVKNEVIGKLDTSQVTISGEVLSKNESVPFANITLLDDQNKSVGTITDSEGIYKILVKPGKYTIKFYCSGYNKVTIQKLQVNKGEQREIIVDLGILGGNHTYYILSEKELNPEELKKEQEKLSFE